MSKLAGYLLVVGLAPTVLRGQDLRVMRERLQREVQLAAEARAATEEYRSLERRFATATDTVVIAEGSITVLADRNIATVARQAARQADSVLRQVSAVLLRIRGDKVYIALDTITQRYQGNADPVVVIRYSVPPHRTASHNIAKVNVEEIARLIEGTAVGRATTIGRTPFTAWRRGNLPLRAEDLAHEPDWGNVRFDLLESPSVLGPRCYRGDIVACSMQLGLTPVEDPVMAWYDSLTRISAVKRDTARTLRWDEAATRDCLTGNDAACGRALHAIRMFELPPAGPFSRDALTWQAIRMGGEGAIERLIMSGGTPAEALAAAAKVPADSVIKAWHRNIREGSLSSDDLHLPMMLVALGWVALLAFLSTRITRWR
jgi:hypothetical protein